MAGDWIKIERSLPRKPKVVAMANRLGLDRYAVVGRLVDIWAWADEVTLDGSARGVTRSFIDDHVGVAGFAAAMELVGWLEVANDGICFPRFDTHNGQTAKRRALTASRVAKHREVGGNGESVTREEKRREEKKTLPSPSQSRATEVELWGKPPIQFRPGDGEWIGITDDDRRVWREAYPACDLEHELRAMAAWCRSNPRGRKSNYKRFMTGWLARQQDKGGSRSNGGTGSNGTAKSFESVIADAPHKRPDWHGGAR